MPAQFTAAELEAFLEESLCPERAAEIESALRDEPALADQLSSVAGRSDAGIHSLGAVWRRRRLSCPSREELGSYLLEVLDEAHAGYVKFHVERIGCRYCTASLADLRERHAAQDEANVTSRRAKYYQTSAGYLSRDE